MEKKMEATRMSYVGTSTLNHTFCRCLEMGLQVKGLGYEVRGGADFYEVGTTKRSVQAQD